MITTTKAIVLSTIKYADYDIIVKCYTELGLKSYLVKRIFKQKKGKLSPAFFQPLTQLEITAKYNPNKTLHFIKEANVGYSYTTIFADVAKQTIAVFLSEVLTKVLREEETNHQLFTYLETAFIWLDTHHMSANFHLLFLMNLTKYLGFYPEKDTSSLYFDLAAGKFSNQKPLNQYISGENLIHFKMLLGTNFDVLHELKFNKKIRQTILENVIQYFQLHLPGFNKPKSLEVLKAVFS
jgi:DNA repair protein RecO (recombination protein O)